MSIWVYNGVSREPYHVWSGNTCTFCRADMKVLHRQMEDIKTLKTVGSYERRVLVCPVCGWWKADGSKDIEYWVHHSHVRSVEGAAASLRELDLSDLRTPIEEVRSYLSAKYEERFTMHPRLFEETIASVFRDLGYSAEATAYSGDDGIDVILKRGDETIGIQAKRYRQTIEVDQIRSLAGALVLGGMTHGMFVTTSGFQSGGKSTTAKFATRGYQIELLDAGKFYNVLNIAQRKMYGAFEEFPVADVLSRLVLIDDYYLDTYNRLSFEKF